MRALPLVVTLVLFTSPCSAQSDAPSPSPSPSPSASPSPSPTAPTTGDPRLDALLDARREVDLHALALGLLGRAGADRPDPSPKLLKAYAAVVDDSESARTLVAQAFVKYLANRHSAKSAVQVSQVAQEAAIELQVLQAVQNQRIIELLKDITRGRPAPAALPKK